jgi:Mrp family chromosome partitioning ATPase
MPFLNTMREIQAALATRAAKDATPIMAVIGAGDGRDRSIAALNIALSAARDGARVLLIDADQKTCALSNTVAHLGKEETGRLGWLNIAAKAAPKAVRAIKTANGISILPAVKAPDAKAGEAIRKAIAQARSTGGYDLIVVDGPAMPWCPADHKLFEAADGLVAILPIKLDINDCMEDIITALGEAERKLVGVVINELHPTDVNRQRDKQYA